MIVILDVFFKCDTAGKLQEEKYLLPTNLHITDTRIFE